MSCTEFTLCRGYTWEIGLRVHFLLETVCSKGELGSGLTGSVQPCFVQVRGVLSRYKHLSDVFLVTGGYKQNKALLTETISIKHCSVAG